MSAASPSPLLELRQVGKSFPIRHGLFSRRRGGLVHAVDGVSLQVQRGETLALVGESGSGKSTVARLALRLLPASAGTVHFQGRNITALAERDLRPLRRSMQMVFQDPFASLNPRMNVRQILEEPLIVHQLGDADHRRARVDDLLRLVNLTPDHGLRYPHEFSGGQRQRIGIARALALEPELIVCDEPVSALDVSIQAQVINLLQDLQQRLGLAYLFIAHDLAVVKHMADRVAVMYLGKLMELAPAAALFARPRHPYTRMLLSAIPRPDPSYRLDRQTVSGELPSPTNPPPGCRFQTRCPYATQRCRAETPELLAGPDGHAVACHHAADLPPAGNLVHDSVIPPKAAQRLALYDQHLRRR